MTTKKANKLMNTILKEDVAEIGVFISLLSYEYMQNIGISKEEFLEHLKNSLDIIEKGE